MFPDPFAMASCVVVTDPVRLPSVISVKCVETFRDPLEQWIERERKEAAASMKKRSSAPDQSDRHSLGAEETSGPTKSVIHYYCYQVVACVYIL